MKKSVSYIFIFISENIHFLQLKSSMPSYFQYILCTLRLLFIFQKRIRDVGGKASSRTSNKLYIPGFILWITLPVLHCSIQCRRQRQTQRSYCRKDFRIRYSYFQFNPLRFLGKKEIFNMLQFSFLSYFFFHAECALIFCY